RSPARSSSPWATNTPFVVPIMAIVVMSPSSPRSMPPSYDDPAPRAGEVARPVEQFPGDPRPIPPQHIDQPRRPGRVPWGHPRRDLGLRRRLATGVGLPAADAAARADRGGGVGMARGHRRRRGWP